MIQIPKKQCFGCGVCEAVCPAKAIAMKPDEEGFSYPVIDRKQCVQCRRCQKACPALSKVEIKKPDKEADTVFQQLYFAAFHKNKEIVRESSSGGVFTAAADAVLAAGGIVYGALFDELFCVRQERAASHKEMRVFRGSKYVQSDMHGIYYRLEEDLKKNQMVLFSGTPCQVNAVKHYMNVKGINCERFYTIDFICHGVSSPAVWKNYIRYLESRYGKRLKRYIFRGKKDGWHNWYPLVYLEDKTGEIEISEDLHRKDSYILMYQSMLFNRPSCFGCPYTSYKRVADLTLGDFWNIKKIAPRMDDNTGTSEVLVNTQKGKELLDGFRENLTLLACSRKDVWQPHLEYPNASPRGREKFWHLYFNSGMDKVVAVYGKGDLMTRLKNAITPVLKKTGLYVLFGRLYRILFVRASAGRKEDGRNE